MRLLSHMREWRGLATEAFQQTSILAKFLCLLYVTNNYGCSSTSVYGVSMLPTLNLEGDVILIEHVSHRIGKLRTGDLVLVKSPVDPRKNVTKRIMGMEGDRVTFLVDPDNSERCQTILVPKDHVWIQGDNTYASYDSRNFGPVPYGLVQGKAFWRVWPPSCFGSLQQ